MANNPPFPGAQVVQPPRPPVTPMGPPQNALPSMPMQFRQPVPPPQPPPYRPIASQQFLPVGMPGIGIPSHPQQLQFPQPLQHPPARPGQLGHSLPPPQLPQPQAFPLSDVQPNRPIIPVSPQRQQAPPIPSNYIPGLGGPRMAFSVPYTPSAPSTSQLHRNVEVTNQFQPTSHTSMPNFPYGGPACSLDSQSMKDSVPMQKSSEQILAAATPLATSEQPSIIEKAPSDWIEHTNRAGKRYYYNKKTRESSWEKPLELMTAIERADASTDWKEYTAPDGRKYYYNRVTKHSKWMIPDEVKLAREQVKNDSIEVPPLSQTGNISSTRSADNSPSVTREVREVAPSPVLVAPVIATEDSRPVMTSESLITPIEPSIVATNSTGGTTPPETTAAVTSTSGEIEVPVPSFNPVAVSMSNSDEISANDTIAPADGSAVGDLVANLVNDAKEATNIEFAIQKTEVVIEDKPLDQETPVYENKLEAKKAFLSLLEGANIASDWTWDQVMRVINNDQRYDALKTLGERKQAFNEFLGLKKKQEAEERRSRQKKAKEEFKKMLEESKELTSSTRWSKASTLFEDDDRFKAVERSKDREDIFEDHLIELEKKERAKALEEHRRNKMEYIEFLKSCDFITASSQWRKVQDRLEDDERCTRLEKIDRLEIFQEYLRDLEKEEEEQRKLRMEELRKAERKNRDDFRKLMEGHIASGTLTTKTHWRDYCLKVKELPAYLAVSSNSSGATPKDLFEDVVEELEKQFLEDKDRIKEAVKMGKISVLSTWTLEDFKASISEEIGLPPVSDVNLKLVFDELQERVREKEEKEAKRRKRLADDFYGSLGTVKEVTSSSKWEDCKPLFEDRQESWFNIEESFFREIFEKYIAELKEKAREKERKRREEKAKKDMEGKERERRKEKQRRDKERDKGKDRPKKDATDSDNGDRGDSYSFDENKRSGRDKDKKHRKRHQNSLEDMNLDEDERGRSKNSHTHGAERKKSKQMEQQASALVSDYGRHKRYKRDHGNGSHRHGDYEELKEREVGEDGELW